MMIASEQANFDAHDWTGQLMLTNEQANFHHGFGRAWRQILKLVRGTAIATCATKNPASAQKEPPGRGTVVIGISEKDEKTEKAQ